MEAGSQVVEKLVMPCLRHASAAGPMELQQFYCGIFMSLMGALAADVGHPQALWLVRSMVDTFAEMEQELGGSGGH